MNLRSPSGRHAVVIGAGFAGLLAARVLADHFPRVTVVEQDRLTEDTEYRRGVPHARHTHGLLHRGATILEELCPGLRAELAGIGAPIFDLGESSLGLFPSGWAPRGAIGIPTQTCTRAALERGIRRRVMAYPNITIRDGIRVEGLCWDKTRSRVTGVLVRPRPSDTSQQPDMNSAETVEGDLVVDTSGRTSALTCTALAEAGYPSPEERTVEGNLSYSSRLYDIPLDMNTDWMMTGEATYAPSVRRGAVVVPVEKKRWLVTLIGAGGETTPADEAGFLAYAQSLRNPHIAASIATASPVTPIYRVVKLNNRWTLFHRMRQWPERLLCLGDVVCCLNPIYAQGMTLAAVEAKILDDLLKRRGGNLAGLARTFQRRTARTLRLPWLMATSADLAWKSGHAPLYARIAHWYLDRLIAALPHDLGIYRRFFEAAQMVKNPAILLHPHIVSRLATARLAQRRDKRRP